MHNNRSSWGRVLRVGPRKGLALAAVVVLLVLLLVTGVRPVVSATVLVVTAAAMVAGFLVLEARRTAEEARREADARRRRWEATQRRAQRKLARQVRAAAAQSRQAARQSRRAASQSARAARLAGRAVAQTRTPSPARPTGSPKPKVTRPVEPADPWLSPTCLSQWLWSGFTSDALDGLQRLTVDRHASPLARGRAFLELARWHGADGHDERALEMVRMARVAHPSLATQPPACAYEADFLCGLGRRVEARELLEDPTFAAANEADRLLRLANTYATGDDEPWQATTELVRLGFVNQVFLRSGFAPVSRRDPRRPLGFDNLVGVAAAETGAGPDAAKVTVLMPAYNAADVIERALASVLAQTWRNLEVLVVDDASVDSTADVVEAVAAGDSRVRLVRQPSNQGAYAARNAGLAEASGDLVTVHDADDWSHPQKIETLADRLCRQPRLVGALAHHVRAFADLVFTVPGLQPSDKMVALNWSSLMVRRDAFAEVGSWDMVRAAGDSEMLRRLEAYYGADRLERLHPEVPLSFSMVTPTSLTSASRTGFPSLWQALGARRQYRSAFLGWHASPSFTSDLPLTPDREDRPVVAPALLRVDREAYSDRFDVVMLSDFSLPGGTTASNIQEIRAQVRGGMRVGLLHHRPRHRSQCADLNPALSSLIDGDQVRLLSNGERIGCDLLTVRFPRAAEHLMDEMPVVKAGHVKVIVNQLPFRLYGVSGEQPTYDIGTCQRSLERHFGSDVTWHPIGPVVRTMLLEHHAAELAAVRLSAEDWLNVIDVDAWRRPDRRPPDGTVRIGRHARDVSEKWPEDVEALRQSYPDRAGHEVHVLGGATVPESLLGARPASWTVHAFDSLPVRDFLHGLDVYVYQTHSRWVEAFGRSVLEALAVGLPVVTAPAFEPLFGPAAVYAEPHEVLDKVDALMSDAAAYDRQVRCANAVVEERFSFDAHLERLRRAGVGVHCEPTGHHA